MKTIIAAYSQNRSGSRASVQAALHTLLTVPWPSQREFRTWIQLLSVLQWILSFLLMGIVFLFLLIYLVFTSFWPVSALYLAWVIFDWDAPEQGMGRWEEVSMGAKLACLEAFPRLLPYSGLCPVTRQAIGYLLSQNGSGNAVAVVIGGAAESLSCQPGITTLILKNRKGFVRMALQHGAHLVPAFSFGENDLFRQVVFEEGSWMRGIQKRFQKLVGFAPCVFYGRGLTSIHSRGFLPYPKPITTVIGEPVTVPRIKEPSHETVDLYHAMYIRSLLKLFNDHKAKYGLSEADELRIL
ncbi:diacylglycerol O-acyltransferase 2 isoform X2 [Caretta caretta]|uniref:diacylglycerol O-acyltransferase 2 isoform X2 n=1 Tax=Caretta caretta TaxID=8467 RepID=UPI0020944D01|nr:diacylglycerol O-acyltransferase 2-like isoform X2 [Caretta caretta]